MSNTTALDFHLLGTQAGSENDVSRLSLYMASTVFSSIVTYILESCSSYSVRHSLPSCVSTEDNVHSPL